MMNVYLCAACTEPIHNGDGIIRWEGPDDDISVAYHAECAPPLIEEEGTASISQPGPMIVGQRCPWCGDLVLDADHSRSHD